MPICWRSARSSAPRTTACRPAANDGPRRPQRGARRRAPAEPRPQRPQRPPLRAARAGPTVDGSEVAPLPRRVPVRALGSVSLLLLQAGSERSQPAAYTLAHDRLRAAQVLRDVRVVALVDDTGP